MYRSSSLTTLAARLERRLDQRGSLEHQGHVAAEVLRTAEIAIARVRNEKTGIATSFGHQHAAWFQGTASVVHPFEVEPETSWARLARVGQWAVPAAEVLVGWWLLPAYLAAVTPAHYIGFAALLVGLSYGAAAVAASKVARWSETPALAKRWFTRWTVGIGVAAALLAAIAFVGRAATGPLSWLSGAFLPATAAMAAAAFILAGLLHTTAQFYGWSGRLTSRWRRLDALEADFLVCAAEAQRRRGRLSLGSGHSWQPQVVAAALLVIGMAGALPLSAQQGNEVYIDVSKSTLVTDRAAGKHAVVHAVMTLGEQYGTPAWHVIPFAEDGFEASPAATLAFPLRPDTACGAPHFTKAARVLAQVRAVEIERHTAHCAARIESGGRAYGMAAASTGARLAWLLDSLTARDSRCTSVSGVLSRLRYRTAASLAIVLTDGRDSCAHAPEVIPAPGAAGRAIVILLLKPGEGPQGFERRAADIRRRAPWVEVVAPWTIRAWGPQSASPVAITGRGSP